jgi:hypothetical protein
MKEGNNLHDLDIRKCGECRHSVIGPAILQNLRDKVPIHIVAHEGGVDQAWPHASPCSLAMAGSARLLKQPRAPLYVCILHRIWLWTRAERQHRTWRQAKAKDHRHIGEGSLVPEIHGALQKLIDELIDGQITTIQVFEVFGAARLF